MKTKTLAEIRAQRPHITDQDIAAERQAVDAALALSDLREARGVTQTALADALEISRPRVSTIENAREDMRLSTVQRYVEALGGELRITAVFDDEEMALLPRA